MRRWVWAFVLSLGVLGALVLYAALRLHQPASGTPAQTVLVFDVPDEIEEGELPFPDLSLDWVRWRRSTLYTLVRGIERAATDDRVSALVLHVGDVNWGWAKIAEMRDAIDRFRAAGKPVYALLETGGGEAEYLLASVADRVAIPPTAVLQLDGLSASAVFLRGGLDKLGIRPNYAHAGRFKSAVEGYTRTGMSPDTREALAALLDDTYIVIADSIATARGLSPDSVSRLFDEGPFNAPEALASGLVDTLLHESDLDSLALLDAGDDAATLSLSRYAERGPVVRGGAHIALVTASGTIESGRSRSAPGDGVTLGSDTIIDALRQARLRRAIRAVVLRIDSPGGELQAADDIWREVRRCSEAKPVVVSMSDYAASGGYYIATGADRIVAQPLTVTGSIGVFGGKLNLLGLYHKLGLNVETVSRGRHAEMLSPFSDFTPDEARRYQRQIDEGYETFLGRVVEGRDLTHAEADSAAQGRVWSGIAAWSLGLVDTLGGLETAIQVAREQAGLPPGTPLVVDRFPRVEHPLLERLVRDWIDEDDRDATSSQLPPVIRAWLEARHFPAGAALALMPFSVEIR